MKNIFKFLTIVLAFFVTSEVCGSMINVRAYSAREEYLRYEPIKFSLQIQNQSGNPLEFTTSKAVKISNKQREELLKLPPEKREEAYKKMLKDESPNEINSSLELIVWEGKGTSGLSKHYDFSSPLDSLKTLRTGETKQVFINVNKIVKIFSKPGIYTIEARVKHSRLGTTIYRSNRFYVNILDGRVIKKVRIGIPSTDSNSVIKERHGVLQQSISSQNRFYFFQIQDNRRCFLTTRLAHVINMQEPSLYVDSLSNFHLLFMVETSLYEHRVYSHSGKLLIRAFYKSDLVMSNPIPRLVKDVYGQVNITGGEAAQEGVDYNFKKADNEGDLPTARAIDSDIGGGL